MTRTVLSRLGRLAAFVLVAALLLGLLLPSGPVAAQGPTAVVVGGGPLNVRTGPNDNYPIVMQVQLNTLLYLIGRIADNTWLQVQVPNGPQGWVSTLYIWTTVPLDSLPITWQSQPQPAVPPGSVARVTGAYYLNVRSGPSATYGIVARIQINQLVNLVGRTVDNSWVLVDVLPGVRGWVSTRYVTANVPLSILPIAFANQPPAPPAQVLVPQTSGSTSGGTSGYQRTHTVQAGENLFRIALRYGVSVQALAAANNIYNYNLIYTGQVLVIP